MQLKKYLESREISPREFADKVGVTKQAISRYLRGRVPRQDVVMKINKITRGEVGPNDFYGVK